MQLLSRTHGTNKVYLFYSFSWIKIQNKNEDVHVTKLVDIVTSIPKHLDLYFSDFPGIFKVHSKIKKNLTRPYKLVLGFLR